MLLFPSCTTQLQKSLILQYLYKYRKKQLHQTRSIMIPFEKLSFWEQKYINSIDFLIVGSGIVGITTALSLRKRFSNANIVILERGYFPTGASTKNAGFSCFGSPTEILEDLKVLSEDQVIALIRKRYEGLQLLRKWIPDAQMDHMVTGTHELFGTDEQENFTASAQAIQDLNRIIEEATLQKDCFTVDDEKTAVFHNIKNAIKNQYEGRLHTGKMMQAFLHLACENNIRIMNGIEVQSIVDEYDKVIVNTEFGELQATKVIVTNNAFAQKLLPDLEVQPARAQVLITTPFKKLPFEGAFHMNAGYFYFRTIENRILIGGGRHLDFKNETTDQLETSEVIQKAIEDKLHNVIMGPSTNFKIEHRWSGIMGVGRDRFPIIKEQGNTLIGVKLGGMGVAMGSKIGAELAEKL